jgi:malonyl-CoA O-methyltransferase
MDRKAGGMNDFSQRVAARFDAAAASYDAHSGAQRAAAHALMARIVAQGLPAQARVLEIGCGTGHLTELLARHLPGASILATDLAPAMVAACRSRLGANPRLRFEAMDARRPASTDFYDLICGNLVAQWFDDLPTACARLAACLAPRGVLALSLLGPDTFREWRAAHARLGLVPGTRALPSARECRAALPGATRVEREHWQDAPADALAFLRSLRAIGADTPAPGHRPLPPGALRRVLAGLGPAPTITYEFIHLIHRAP